MNDIVAAICEQFPIEDHQQRPGGRGKLTYVSVDATIRRMNEACDGIRWSWSVDEWEWKMDNGKHYVAMTGSLSVFEEDNSTVPMSIRAGAGGAEGNNIDDVMKTAMAECFKKAFNMFGGGNYLWMEKWRERVELYLDDNCEGMQSWLVDHAISQGADATPAAIAQYYNVDKKNMAEPETLRRLMLELFDT